MNGLQVSLLTGLGAKAAVEYLSDVGIADITPRQLTYKNKDGYKDILTAEQAQLFVASLTNPLEGELHNKVAENYAVLTEWFGQPVADVVPAAPLIVEDDLFAVAPEPELVVEAIPAPVVEDDLFAEPTPDVDDLLDQPSVGAEPTEYDRSALEKDESGMTTLDAPAIESEEDDLFGDLGL